MLTGEQDLSLDGDAPKIFVAREPISLFHLRKNARNEEEKENFTLLLGLLKKKLPDGFKLGAAIGEEDSFFDSIAQGLNELRDKGLITSPNAFSVKFLRESCKKYAQQVYQLQKDSWLINALKENGMKLRKYIQNVEFTARNIEKSSSKTKVLWGRPEIEGNMICEKYGLKVRIIELRDQEIGFVTKRKFGTGTTTIFIVNYRNHFVPLLSNMEKNVKKRIYVCTEEVYGNVISSNSKDFSQPHIPTLLFDVEDASCQQNARSRSSSKEDRKRSRKRRCSVADQGNKAPKRACMEVITVNGEDTNFPTDFQDEFSQVELHRKRRCSMQDIKERRVHSDVQNICNRSLNFFDELQSEHGQDKMDKVYQNNRCIPHQLIRFMYQLDLSVLCLIRKSIYKYKYPSLSLEFGYSENEKFGNITFLYEAKSIHVQIENVDKYYTNNDINYGTLFNKGKGKQRFYLNNYFDSFVKRLLFNSINNVDYLIIYSNSGLSLTDEIKLIQSRSRNFYPFEFDSMNIENYDILKDFLCTNGCIKGCGFYKFSQITATRKELFKRIKFSSAMRNKIKERNLPEDFEKDTKEAFLDKLIFAVNQPIREELNAIVKKEIIGGVKENYLELQKEILSDLTAKNCHKNYKKCVSELMYSFSLLLLFLYDMLLHENIFSINFNGKNCKISDEIAINYKNRTTCIKIFYADRNIGYSQLFPSKRGERDSKFSINKHFMLFIEALEKDKNIRYYVIYTNKGLDLTEEKVLKKAQTKDFHPFKFDRIDIEKKRYKKIRSYLGINKNDLYQFSQENATKVYSLLKLPPSSIRDKDDSEKDIKEIFFHKLIFAVNQPTREDLQTIMINEIETKSNEIPYTYEELHEITLCWLESCDCPITKEVMKKLMADIRNNRSSYQKIQNQDISEEIKFAKGVVGMEGTPAFNQFLGFLIKGNGIKYLEVLKENKVNLPNMSSILNGAGTNAVKAFEELYDLWFDTEGNKTHYLKALEEEGVKLACMSSILNGAGKNAARSSKELYDLWFDAKGNKVQYLKTLEEEGVNVTNMSSVLNGAGNNAAKAFRELYDLWFDAEGNKTLYLKALEKEGINVANMSSVLNGAGSNAAKAFKELYDLWFTAEGNKTQYLKTLEEEGVNIASMSCILSGAGVKASEAFEDLYDLWFDVEGNKTQYLKTLEKEEINLAIMSSILSKAGGNAAKAFKGLYNLWFDPGGNKTQYLRTLEKEGINLKNVSSILHGAAANAVKAFQELYNLWFDAGGNKTYYLKTLEEEGINLTNVSSILHGAGSNAVKAFKELYNIFFDKQGKKRQHLNHFLKKKDEEIFTPQNLSSMLCGAGASVKDSFEKLHSVCYNDEGERTDIIDDFYSVGFRPGNLSCLLCGAGIKASSILKRFHGVCFNEKREKTKLLDDFFNVGFSPDNLCNILSGAPDSLKKFHCFFFEGETKKYLNHFLNDAGGFTPKNLSNILHGARMNICSAFKDFHDVCFSEMGNRTQLLDDFHEADFKLKYLSDILSMAGNNAASVLRGFHQMCFNKEHYLNNFLTLDKLFAPKALSKLLKGAGMKVCSAFEKLHNLCFDKEGNNTYYLNNLIKDNSSNKILDILYKQVRKASPNFLDKKNH